MNFWTLFIANIIVSFSLAFILVKYGIQYKKFYSFFTEAPNFKFKEKITLDPTVKFKAEYGMSLFLIPLSLVMLAILSYVLTVPLPGVDQGEFFFMCLIGETMIILMSAMTTKVTFETLFQDKELRDISVHELYITDEGFSFPITPLEGEWREIARKARRPYLTLKTEQIAHIDVIPASGFYNRHKPPYYVVTLKDHPMKIHFMRKQFYGNEKKFLDIALSRGIKVNINDELRD